MALLRDESQGCQTLGLWGLQSKCWFYYYINHLNNLRVKFSSQIEGTSSSPVVLKLFSQGPLLRMTIWLGTPKVMSCLGRDIIHAWALPCLLRQVQVHQWDILLEKLSECPILRWCPVPRFELGALNCFQPPGIRSRPPLWEPLIYISTSWFVFLLFFEYLATKLIHKTWNYCFVHTRRKCSCLFPVMSDYS